MFNIFLQLKFYYFYIIVNTIYYAYYKISIYLFLEMILLNQLRIKNIIIYF